MPCKKTSLILSVLILASAFFSACSTLGEARDVDPKTGRIPIRSMGTLVTAQVVKSDKINLAKYQGLALVLGDDFFVEQTKKLSLFEEVVDRQGMEKLLIKEGKDSLVTDVTNLLSWKKISNDYKLFLVIKPDIRKEGRAEYFQLKVITPDTADEVFIAEVKIDMMWKGVSDDTVFLPVFNAFLDWIDKNKN